MATAGALVLAVALLFLVLYWSSHYGGRGRKRGVSLRRGPRAHTTLNGQPKIAFTKREVAEERARLLTKRDGVRLDVYQCGTCAKWHIGHSR